jgi:hypothetical protein
MPPDLVARAFKPSIGFGGVEMDIGNTRALADHIDGMVQEHWLTMAQWGGEQVVCCGRCRYGDGVSYRSPCPSLRLVADLVSTVLGRDING